MSESCEIYCLSYNNEERKKLMESRFVQLNLRVNFYEGVDVNTDERITKYEKCYKQCWSCMYGHLDMIYKFYNDTDKEFGIFCEDDIYIHKNFSDKLTEITEKFRVLNLDVLLLGCLITEKIQDYHHGFQVLDSTPNHKYHCYPDHVWGTQMYMISRNNAKKILDKYYNGYAEKTLEDGNSLTPFSADWTITKDGNRAIIYPMVAAEDGKSFYEHWGQNEKHKQAHLHNYNAEEFI